MLDVTVAIPTYNRPGFLQRALRSVLRQTQSARDVIVLDNASGDPSWRSLPELADPRVRLVCHPVNIGVVNNWNVAIAESREDALCILHDDDLMHPRFLEVTARSLEASPPSVGMVFSQARRVDCMGAPLGIWWDTAFDGVISGRDYVLWSLRIFGALTTPSSVVFRRSACEAVGGFGGGVSVSAFDVEYFFRIAKRYDIGFINQALSDYTLHPHQISEEYWRRRRREGVADTCLEMLAGAAWLLDGEALTDDVRREVATVISKAARHMSEYVRGRTDSPATL